jgi:hypothetical protein
MKDTVAGSKKDIHLNIVVDASLAWGFARAPRLDLSTPHALNGCTELVQACGYEEIRSYMSLAA